VKSREGSRVRRSVAILLSIGFVWLLYHSWGKLFLQDSCSGSLTTFLNTLLGARISGITPEYCFSRLDQLISFLLITLSIVVIFVIIFASWASNRQLSEKPWLQNWMSSFVAILVIFLLGEIGIRLYQKAASQIPFSRNLIDFYDPVLGWKGKEQFGDFQAQRPKILFIGDSFTEAKAIDESAKFFNIVRDELNIEPFVYGRTSYGTLQEYLILDRYIDLIKPDVIVLQVCSNDFINNSYELEKQSFFNNKRLQRPYWIDGRIQNRFPRSSEWVHAVKFQLSNHSRLFYFTLIGIDYLSIRLWQLSGTESVEARIEREGTGFDLFRKSVEITDYLIGQMKAKAAGKVFVAFPADRKEPYLNEFRNVFKKHDIPFLEAASVEIASEKDRGIKVAQSDGVHWSNDGQRIAGRSLSKELAPLIQKADSK